MDEVSLRVTEVTPEVVEYVCNQIVEDINPRQVVLFGSQATGDATSESDLDLLVVHDGTETNRAVRRRLDRLFLNRRFGLDLIVRTPLEVERNLADSNPFYTEHIFGKGVVVYERADSG